MTEVLLFIPVTMASYIDFSKPSLWGEYKLQDFPKLPAATGCDD